MNVALWIKALRVIPRVSQDEWRRLDVIARWLIATRSAVLIMTFLASAIAGLLAWRAGVFELGAWLALSAGLLLAHATNNLLNDLTDHLKGVDRDNYFRAQYGPQPLEHGLMSLRQVLLYAGVTGALALGAGGYLVATSGSLTLPLLIVGAIFVLFYTYPLKYIGLGELAVLLVWGPLMIGGGYYVLTGQWSWPVVVASLPYALGPTTVIFGKHIDKLAADKAKGIYTLPVLLGEPAARAVVLALIALHYLLVIGLVGLGFFTPLLLVVLLALPRLRLVVPVFRHPRPAARPEAYPAEVWPLWYVAFAFWHTRRFGALFVLGLLLELALAAIKG